MEVSIIVVNYNTKDYLRDCLSSIENSLKSGKIGCEIIVVDNASSDGSAEMVKKEFNSVFLIANSENGGFSKANNQGVEKAKGNYLFFLNPDTVVENDTIYSLFSFMEHNQKTGAATAYVSLPNGTLDDASHRGFPTPWNSFCYFSGLSQLFPSVKLFNGYTLSFMDKKETHEIDACAGACMMVRKSAGKEVGWWDEDFFWYGEDLDFCYRLKRTGWKIFFVPSVRILHYKGVSGGIKKISQNIATANKETKIRSTRARFGAMLIFYDKHYRRENPFFISWLVVFAIRLRLFFSLRSIK